MKKNEDKILKGFTKRKRRKAQIFIGVEWINKSWHIHPMEFYLPTKIHELPMDKSTRMNLPDIMHERNQTKEGM